MAKEHSQTELSHVLVSSKKSPLKLGLDQDGDPGLYGASNELLYYLDADSIGALQAIAGGLQHHLGLSPKHHPSIAAQAYCEYCDSPCEGGECDPPHLCRKHSACTACKDL